MARVSGRDGPKLDDADDASLEPTIYAFRKTLLALIRLFRQCRKQSK